MSRAAIGRERCGAAFDCTGIRVVRWRRMVVSRLRRFLWGVLVDGFQPDRWDVAGALVCLAGVGLIMYAPR